MKKRIFTVTNCKECGNSCLTFEKGYQTVCKESEKTCPEKGIPKWCPLPYMPEPMEKPRKEKGTYERGYQYGWNAALAAIKESTKPPQEQDDTE